MKRFAILTIVACLAISISLSASAQNRKPKQRREGGAGFFVKADSDGDGKVSFGDITSVRPNFKKKRFETIDKNNDGFITKDERSGLGGAGVQGGTRLIQRADTDGDGKVSFEELKANNPKTTEKRFKRMDRNGDSFITKDELGGAGGGKRAKQGKQGPGLNVADKDKDGNITLKEFKSSLDLIADGLFKRLDANGDGILQKNETGPNTRGTGRAAQEVTRQQVMVVQKLKTADKDGDKKVSREEFDGEFPNAPERMFGNLDRDKSGFISTDEYPKQRKSQQQGQPRGNRRQAFMERMNTADTDSDGKVTHEEFKVEFPNANISMFKRLDKNQDGVYDEGDHKAKNK